LYRAAAAENPHTGFRSYWVDTEDHAGWFQGWLEQQFPSSGTHRVYRAEVQLTDVWNEPPWNPLDSYEVTRRAADWAAMGLRWFTFYEPSYAGWMPRQYLYLGQEPIPVQPA
jgi:hypothetical protein